MPIDSNSHLSLPARRPEMAQTNGSCVRKVTLGVFHSPVKSCDVYAPQSRRGGPLAEDPDRFRLPDAYASNGDPVDGNPFPKHVAEHRVWEDETRIAEEMVARLNQVC